MKKYIALIISLFVAALNFNLFLKPLNLVTGGNQGIAIIIKYLTKLKPSFIILFINIIALIICYLFLKKETTTSLVISSFSYPLFVKPVRAGSSFGITKISDKSELVAAVDLAFEHDTEVIVEENIEGFEVGCAVLGIDEVIVGRVDEIELSQGFFDFTEKYTLKSSSIHMPARLDAATEKRIQETAIKIYKALGCSGFSRVDMFYTPSGEIVFNEVNTIPGFTSHSRYPNMMKGIGLSFAQMLEKLIGLYL